MSSSALPLDTVDVTSVVCKTLPNNWFHSHCHKDDHHHRCNLQEQFENWCSELTQKEIKILPPFKVQSTANSNIYHAN